MNSMTGYGRGRAEGEGLVVTVELKSVNHRFCDIHIRAPREYAALENAIGSTLRGRLGRGRIDVHLRRRGGSSTRAVVDEDLARSYAEELQRVGGGIPGVDQAVSVQLLARLAGVVGVEEAEIDAEGEWTTLEAALQQALTDLCAMRASEGEALLGELNRILDSLKEHIDRVAGQAEGIAQRLQARLEARIQRLLDDGAEPQRIAQEAALQADKADITEELARLASHLQQFREAVASPEPVGRRLDFLAQEMNREINTIGSKSVDASVSALVVTLKTEVERLREQVANVE